MITAAPCALEKCRNCKNYRYNGLPFNWCLIFKKDMTVDEWCRYFKSKEGTIK